MFSEIRTVLLFCLPTVHCANTGERARLLSLYLPHTNRTERQVIHLYCIIQMLQSHWERRRCSLSIADISIA